MAASKIIQAIGPSAPVADRKTACQRSVNLYVSEVESLGETNAVTLESAPGYTSFLTLAGDVRGSYNAGGRWFVVGGTTLYEIQGGAATVRGIVPGSGFVSMKRGRDQVMMVSEGLGYVYRLNTDVLEAITDTDWQGSDWIEESDGYFISVAPESDQFQVSAIDDATAVDALDFSSADSQPDKIVTHRVLKRELYFFGETSTEIWINSGDADFPFVRYNSTPIDVGIVGLRAACNVADTLVWVGQTQTGRGYVYAMNGHQPVRISHRSVEEALSTSTDIGQCVTWAYQVEGHEFVGIQAPGMATTWVWDAASKQWHERGELHDGEWSPLRMDHYTAVDGEHYACAGSVIYHQSPSAYVIGSDALVRERTWPHLVSPSLEDVSYRQLELACTTGHGGNITLEVSNDGGYTFGAVLLRSLGAIGRRMQRVRWLFLGAARDRVFRLRCSDAVPLTIHSATIDAS